MASTSLGVMEQSIALPDDDPVALRALVAAQQARLAEIEIERETQRSELAAARAGLIEQRLEIELLKAKLARALRVAFGRSSEKLRTQLEQLELTLSDLDELLAETTENADTANGAVPAAGKPVRRPLSPALPREVIMHAAPCVGDGACRACGGVLRPLGEDVTEILDYVPGSFRVIRHVRPKLSCRSCETIVQVCVYASSRRHR